MARTLPAESPPAMDSEYYSGDQSGGSGRGGPRCGSASRFSRRGLCRGPAPESPLSVSMPCWEVPSCLLRCTGEEGRDWSLGRELLRESLPVQEGFFFFFAQVVSSVCQGRDTSFKGNCQELGRGNEITSEDKPWCLPVFTELLVVETACQYSLSRAKCRTRSDRNDHGTWVGWAQGTRLS